MPGGCGIYIYIYLVDIDMDMDLMVWDSPSYYFPGGQLFTGKLQAKYENKTGKVYFQYKNFKSKDSSKFSFIPY